MNNSYITIIKEKRTVLSRKRVPLNQNECTADFRIGVPFEQNLQIGDFYGFFSSPRLSVIAPITADMSTKGYVAIHYQMRFLYQNRSGLLKIMQILFLCIYLTTLLLLLLYHWHVQRPLSQIIQGKQAACKLLQPISFKRNDI